MTGISKVRRAQTITSKTYVRLARAISDKVLLPGQQLVADSLANELGVSRTPVREALLILARDGVVELVPGVGAFVKGLELDDLLELFEFREAIELHAVGRMVASPQPILVSRLKARLSAHRDPKSPSEVAEAAEADLEVHHALVKALGNKRMLEAWETLASQLRRFWVDGRSVPSRAHADTEDGLAILGAIERLDSEQAVRLMRNHLDATRKSLIEWRSKLV